MDKKLCINLYKQAFGSDEPDFETALFDNCFECCRYIKQGETIIAMAFLLPCTLKTENQTTDAFYIFAAATDLKYRNMGYMSKLIEDFKLCDKPLFLRPANDSLIEFYKRLGFSPIKAKKCEAIPYLKPRSSFKELANLFYEDATGEEYTAMYFCKDTITLESLNFIYTME